MCFNCAAVSSSDIFESAVSAHEKRFCGKVLVPYSSKAQLKQLLQKYPMMTQRRSETRSASLCQYDLIRPDNKL